MITDRWRQTSDSGQVPALMNHTVMFHPGYGGRQTQGTPPPVKIGMLASRTVHQTSGTDASTRIWVGMARPRWTGLCSSCRRAAPGTVGS